MPPLIYIHPHILKYYINRTIVNSIENEVEIYTVRSNTIYNKRLINCNNIRSCVLCITFGVTVFFLKQFLCFFFFHQTSNRWVYIYLLVFSSMEIGR